MSELDVALVIVCGSFRSFCITAKLIDSDERSVGFGAGVASSFCEVEGKFCVLCAVSEVKSEELSLVNLKMQIFSLKLIICKRL